MMLDIKDEMASEVMHTLAGRAKYYEKAIESGTLLDEKPKAEWQHMADEYWALVRQFSKPPMPINRYDFVSIYHCSTCGDLVTETQLKLPDQSNT